MGIAGLRQRKNRKKRRFQSFGRAVLVASILSVSIGCSTVKVHLDDHDILHPYLGTKTAVNVFIRSFSDYYLYGQQVVMAMDVPLCFVADTLLLPYDLMVKTKRHQRQQNQLPPR